MIKRLTRATLFVGGAGLLAAWLAAAADDQPAPRADVASPALVRAEQLAVEIQAQAARLRERLASAPRPAAGGRNPFALDERSARPGAARVAAAMADEIPAVVTVPEPPLLVLSGIAEDGAPGATVRTAILSGLGDVFLVKAGDVVASRFEVVAVGADAVELRDLGTGRTIRLALR
ncbi:MAG TPA: hypothetical protein VK886_03200 [Vicinamibacterales bacterium]|nr:hypothetical protein [Vicinamibacterales bacterium]